MRVPRRAIPIQPLTYMWERHKEIARLQVTGMRPIDIAEKLGIQTCRLSLIMNSPVYKDYLATLSAKREESAFDLRRELEKGAKKGVELLNSFLNDEEVPKKLKASIAQDFLDRSGYGKTSKVETKSLNLYCSESKIEELKRKQRELLSGVKMIEAEVIPNEG